MAKGRPPLGWVAACLLWAAGAAAAWAQAPSSQNRLFDTTPELLALNQQDNRIEIRYRLPFEGLVRFDLYNEQEELVNQGQFVKVRGDHRLLLDARPLPRGLYTYQIFYKGHTLQDTLRLQ